MHHGLPRKIRIAFVVQMALASLAILLAFYVVTTLFKYSFIQATLKDEARHYWELHEASPVQPPPNPYTLRSHLYNLRKVIDKGFDTPLLHTVQSAGYRMADLARPVQKTAAAQPAASADPIAA